MDTRERLAALARIAGAPTPVVSVYLDTRWADEQQRERVRLFLKNALRRPHASDEALGDDLRWVGQEGERLVAQASFPDADGVAMFACRGLGLREVLPVRVPFEPAFVVADRPFLGPLAALLDRAPRTLVVFVDGARARLLGLDAAGRGEEATLEHEVPGRHARGGWAQITQSRYQRHLEAHRDQHFEAVAHAVDVAVTERAVERIVLAGDARAVARLRRHLPARAASLVAGAVPGAHHEPASALLDRADALLDEQARDRVAAAVDAALTEAAKGGRAVAGLGDALGAVARGAVLRLYLLKAFAQPGGACDGCGGLQETVGAPCRACGKATRETELRDAVVARVIAAGGGVEVLDRHDGLARAGGVAARLRFPV